MKTTILLPLLALANHVTCSRYPQLQYDSDTAKDCIEWYDNDVNEDCGFVRNSLGITPQDFHDWNPSIGLDCTPWTHASYCVDTMQRLKDTANLVTSTPSLNTATPTTSAAALTASPTTWTDRGCYVQNPQAPVLQKNATSTGDASWTVPNCEDKCYHLGYSLVGLQEGNQCWCGNSVSGDWTTSQDDCNVPCAGDKTTSCGGKGLVRVYEAEENQNVNLSPTFPDGLSTTTSSSYAPTGSAAVSGKHVGSGGVRNIDMFWRGYIPIF